MPRSDGKTSFSRKIVDPLNSGSFLHVTRTVENVNIRYLQGANTVLTNPPISLHHSVYEVERTHLQRDQKPSQQSVRYSDNTHVGTMRIHFKSRIKRHVFDLLTIIWHASIDQMYPRTVLWYTNGNNNQMIERLKRECEPRSPLPGLVRSWHQKNALKIYQSLLTRRLIGG